MMNAFSITDDTPLRLNRAAALAFPDGSITGDTLRREAAKGRLDVERIGGKFFTILAAIREMRQRCRVVKKARDSGYAPPDVMPEEPSLIPQDISSSIEVFNTALDSALAKPTKPSAHSLNSSPTSTKSKQRRKSVIPA